MLRSAKYIGRRATAVRRAATFKGDDCRYLYNAAPVEAVASQPQLVGGHFDQKDMFLFGHKVVSTAWERMTCFTVLRCCGIVFSTNKTSTI